MKFLFPYIIITLIICLSLLIIEYSNNKDIEIVSLYVPPKLNSLQYKNQTEYEIGVLDFLWNSENWIFTHLLRPFLLTIELTQSFKNTLLLLLAWEGFEAVLKLVGIMFFQDKGFSKWVGESLGDRWLGDLPQGSLGALLAIYFLMKNPKICKKLIDRRNNPLNLLIILLSQLVSLPIDLISLINFKMRQNDGVFIVIPIGYVFYILVWLLYFSFYWQAFVTKTLVRMGLEVKKCLKLENYLFGFIIWGWVSTNGLYLPTYLSLWNFVIVYATIIKVYN